MGLNLVSNIRQHPRRPLHPITGIPILMLIRIPTITLTVTHTPGGDRHLHFIGVPDTTTGTDTMDAVTMVRITAVTMPGTAM